MFLHFFAFVEKQLMCKLETSCFQSLKEKAVGEAIIFQDIPTMCKNMPGNNGDQNFSRSHLKYITAFLDGKQQRDASVFNHFNVLLLFIKAMCNVA